MYKKLIISILLCFLTLSFVSAKDNVNDTSKIADITQQVTLLEKKYELQKEYYVFLKDDTKDLKNLLKMKDRNIKNF